MGVLHIYDKRSQTEVDRITSSSGLVSVGGYDITDNSELFISCQLTGSQATNEGYGIVLNRLKIDRDRQNFRLLDNYFLNTSTLNRGEGVSLLKSAPNYVASAGRLVFLGLWIHLIIFFRLRPTGALLGFSTLSLSPQANKPRGSFCFDDKDNIWSTFYDGTNWYLKNTPANNNVISLGKWQGSGLSRRHNLPTQVRVQDMTCDSNSFWTIDANGRVAQLMLRNGNLVEISNFTCAGSVHGSIADMNDGRHLLAVSET